MYLSLPSKTRLFAASCAFSCAALLATGGIPAHAQAADTAPSADTIDYLYVSAQGSDSWSGQSPVPAGTGNGPFHTLGHAQEMLSALSTPVLSRPVEIAVDPAVCPAQDFLGRWFSAAPSTPVIWHADAARTILIYTPAMSQQVDALASEDTMHTAASRTTRFYVSAAGNDAWRGLSPAPDADNGPLRTLDHAQEVVAAFLADNPGAPVEVVFETESSLAAAVKPKASAKAAAVLAAAETAADTLIPASHVAPGMAPAIVFGKAPVVIKGTLINGTAATPKLVFAHLMYAADYGGGVAGYERDMQDAQAAGVDGFALNLGSWNDAQYKAVTAIIFQAAHALNSGFKLFFSIDTTGDISGADIQEMIKTYGNDPNYFRYNNRPVLSSWGGETMGPGFWNDQVLTPLRQSGYNVFFVPRFFTLANGGIYETPSAAQTTADANTEWWKNVVDGQFVMNGLSNNGEPVAPNVSGAEGLAAALHANKRLVMSSVSPQYWGNRQITIGRRYFEYSGGEGLARQWQSIINVQKSDWVELFTWNDYDEATYFSPIDDINKYWPYLQHPALGFYKCHAGILKLNHYYVNWFKTGAAPHPATDSFYFAYRTHPKNAVATNDPLGGVSWFLGDIQDDIYVTTILTAPATLVVTTGTQTLSYSVPAGLTNTRVPFQVGAQSFKLVRGENTLLTQTGEPITASSDEYNFIYTTGSAGG